MFDYLEKTYVYLPRQRGEKARELLLIKTDHGNEVRLSIYFDYRPSVHVSKPINGITIMMLNPETKEVYYENEIRELSYRANIYITPQTDQL